MDKLNAAYTREAVTAATTSTKVRSQLVRWFLANTSKDRAELDTYTTEDLGELHAVLTGEEEGL